MVDRVAHALSGEGLESVVVFGLTYKPNTDDLRDSPALDIVPALQSAGVHVQDNNPEAIGEAAHPLPGIEFKPGAYEAAEGADALLLLIEWHQFRALDLGRLCRTVCSPVVADLRTVYKLDDMPAAAFAIMA